MSERPRTARTDVPAGDVTPATTRHDPLDALFRPTVEPGVDPVSVRDDEVGEPPGPPDASAAPHRAEGTRVRAGNAMGRTRAALLAGGVRAVAATGTSITMAQVALSAGVAKATLYNHFRTREAVLAAVAAAEVEALAVRVTGLPLRQALVEIAAAVSTHPALATLREREPGVLAAAFNAAEPCAALDTARETLDALLGAHEVAPEERAVAADVVLRWIFSLAIAPAAPADVLAAADLLVAGLLGRTESPPD